MKKIVDCCFCTLGLRKEDQFISIKSSLTRNDGLIYSAQERKTAFYIEISRALIT